MTAMTALWNPLSFFVRARSRPQSRPAPETDAEAARSRRDFINETIFANPDAFSSELGACAMMSLYPRTF
jgi:hypothetical protein